MGNQTLCRRIAAAIRNGNACAVSDGSFKDELGTSSWVFDGTNAEGRIQGDMAVPGAPTDQCAYRSEIIGLYSIACTLEVLCKLYNLDLRAIIIGCDGLLVIQKTETLEKDINPSDVHFTEIPHWHQVSPCGGAPG
jgi:hypothetical protein